jgi:hypothetical protein
MGLIFTKGQIDDFRQFSIEVQAAKMNGLPVRIIVAGVGIATEIEIAPSMPNYYEGLSWLAQFAAGTCLQMMGQNEEAFLKAVENSTETGQVSNTGSVAGRGAAEKTGPQIEPEGP